MTSPTLIEALPSHRGAAVFGVAFGTPNRECEIVLAMRANHITVATYIRTAKLHGAVDVQACSSHTFVSVSTALQDNA